MNDTSASSVPGASLLPDSTGAFTTAHLALIAVLIVLTVAAIIYGMKLSRRRHVAAREIDRHNAEVEAAPPAPVPADDVPRAAGNSIGATETSGAAATGNASAGAAAGPVTQLKGLGPKVASRLAELGISDVGQLAALDDAGAARLDDDLGQFKGRMARDRWIEQARLLASGDRAGFEAAFGRL